MLGRHITLFHILGFAVRVDASWIVIAVLVTWSLAEGLFPYQAPGWAPPVYWAMGVAGALGLFLSIIFHELSHSLVARRFALPITGITLFIFGGVAEMSEEPRNARSEFFMAIAGPVASVVLAVALYGVHVLGSAAGWPGPATLVIGYLALINGVLAGFNMIPAFPLDGGRVFRAALWAWKGSIRWATRIVAAMGSGFGMVLIGLGVYAVVSGNFIAGMWWALIGLFLHGAARSSYQQVLIRQHLEGEPVRRFMTSDPVVVAPDDNAEAVATHELGGRAFRLLPVVDQARRVLGYVDVQSLRAMSSADRQQHAIGDVMTEAGADDLIEADEDVLKALQRLRRGERGRLMVVDDDRLVGILSVRDLMDYLSDKLDL